MKETETFIEACQEIENITTKRNTWKIQNNRWTKSTGNVEPETAKQQGKTLLATHLKHTPLASKKSLGNSTATDSPYRQGAENDDGEDSTKNKTGNVKNMEDFYVIPKDDILKYEKFINNKRSNATNIIKI